MKDWLSNPKNQPFVVGAGVVVLLAAIVVGMFEFGVFGSATNVASANAPAVATAPAAPAPALAPAPPTPGMAAPAPQPHALKPAAKKAPVKMAAAQRVHNPFQPAVDAHKLIPPVARVSNTVSAPILAALPPMTSTPASAAGGVTRTVAPDQSIELPGGNVVQLGRVAGIIRSNGVHAIYETNDSATVLQPGDPLPGDAGTVQSIQSDGITVKLAGDNRTVQLPVTAGNPDQNGGYGAPGYGGPGYGGPGYGGPGYGGPGGPYGPGGPRPPFGPGAPGAYMGAPGPQAP